MFIILVITVKSDALNENLLQLPFYEYSLMARCGFHFRKAPAAITLARLDSQEVPPHKNAFCQPAARRESKSELRFFCVQLALILCAAEQVPAAFRHLAFDSRSASLEVRAYLQGAQ